MKHIGNLQINAGSRKNKKRIGRGPGSGFGGTATRGHKGQQSRSGYKRKLSFEGGQMPLNRRIPKFGFNNPNRIDYQVVNVSTLQKLVDDNKITDGIVNFDVLHNLGVINKRREPFKILGDGELKAKLDVTAHRISKSAKEKIETAGGSVTVHV